MSIKEQIKAEIERQIENLRGQEKDFLEQDCHTLVEDARARISELNQLLSFLDTLGEKSEKPIITVDLEKEIRDYMSKRWALGSVNPITPVYLYDFTTEELKECARHFYELGIKGRKAK